jgi:recombinational DNA repair protein RecT
LIRRSGEVADIDSYVVYPEDQFEITYGLHPNIVHVPFQPTEADEVDPTEGEHKEGEGVKGVYAVISYKDARPPKWEYMTTAQINRTRKRSKAQSEESPWQTDWIEMARKTVVKRLAKNAPVSSGVILAQKAEDKALAGEPQADLLSLDFIGGGSEPEATKEEKQEEQKKVESEFDELVKAKGADPADPKLLGFLKKTGEGQPKKMTVDQMKMACVQYFDNFWNAYLLFTAPPQKAPLFEGPGDGNAQE